MILSCIIVEDEPLAANLLEEYASHLPYLQVKAKCHNAFEALAFLQSHKVDLIFMDINLPKLSGMDLAKLLADRQKVIFTTAYANYALESYSVNTIDYLLKPVTLDRFIRAVERAALPSSRDGASESTNESIFIKSGKSMVKITYHDIFFIEGLKDYVVFQMEKERYIVYKKMKELEDLLPMYFRRIHLSFIVNTDKINRVEDNHVFIHDRSISIGDKFRSGFITYIKSKLL